MVVHAGKLVQRNLRDGLGRLDKYTWLSRLNQSCFSVGRVVLALMDPAGQRGKQHLPGLQDAAQRVPS